MSSRFQLVGWQPLLDDDPTVRLLNRVHDATVPAVDPLLPGEQQSRETPVRADHPAVPHVGRLRGGLITTGKDALGERRAIASTTHAACHRTTIVEQVFDPPDTLLLRPLRPVRHETGPHSQKTVGAWCG